MKKFFFRIAICSVLSMIGGSITFGAHNELTVPVAKDSIVIFNDTKNHIVFNVTANTRSGLTAGSSNGNAEFEQVVRPGCKQILYSELQDISKIKYTTLTSVGPSGYWHDLKISDCHEGKICFVKIDTKAQAENIVGKAGAVAGAVYSGLSKAGSLVSKGAQATLSEGTYGVAAGGAGAVGSAAATVGKAAQDPTKKLAIRLASSIASFTATVENKDDENMVYDVSSLESAFCGIGKEADIKKYAEDPKEARRLFGLRGYKRGVFDSLSAESIYSAHNYLNTYWETVSEMLNRMRTDVDMDKKKYYDKKIKFVEDVLALLESAFKSIQSQSGAGYHPASKN